jgi:hypothetical protein
MHEKAFTVAEANGLVPVLEGVVAEIRRRMIEIRKTADKLQVLDVLWDGRVREAGNPDAAEAEALGREMTSVVAEIEEVIEREIHGRGLRFPQGGLEHGLIDFPTTWEGRWVLLCWRAGEAAVTAWHEIDAGFAGRQPIGPDHMRLMGKLPNGGWDA